VKIQWIFGEQHGKIGSVKIMVEKNVKVELRVENVEQADLAKEIARIDQATMKFLQIVEEDVVEILGNKKTVAKVHSTRPEDNNNKIIRIDAFMRRNAGTTIGKNVVVSKAEVSDAKIIVLSPKGIRLEMDDFIVKFLKDSLFKRPLMKENIIEVMMLANPVPFIVVDTQPFGSVRVSGNTEIRILTIHDEYNINRNISS
jgi:transitional endoplasmic reticulum ATPase